MLTFKEKKDHNNKVEFIAIEQITNAMNLFHDMLDLEDIVFNEITEDYMDQGYFVEHVNNMIQMLAKKSQDATEIMKSRIKK